MNILLLLLDVDCFRFFPFSFFFVFFFVFRLFCSFFTFLFFLLCFAFVYFERIMQNNVINKVSFLHICGGCVCMCVCMCVRFIFLLFFYLNNGLCIQYAVDRCYCCSIYIRLRENICLKIKFKVNVLINLSKNLLFFFFCINSYTIMHGCKI